MSGPEGVVAMERKPQEACGLFAAHVLPDSELGPIAHELAAVGIGQLAQRGDEHTGLAVLCEDNTTMVIHGEGDASTALANNVILGQFGYTAMAHGRYATTCVENGDNWKKVQPMAMESAQGDVLQEHNGDITNAQELIDFFGYDPEEISSDSHLALQLLKDTLDLGLDPIEAIKHVSHLMVGAYSMITMINGRLFAWRDPWGFRPLSLGELVDESGITQAYFTASEQPAYEVLGGKEIRPIERGELIEISDGGWESHMLFTPEELEQIPERLCVFEFVYFARPDTVLLGRSVEEARVAAGKELWKEAPSESDIVVGSPQSGISAAEGYANESGITKEQGLVKNPKSARRSFMQTNADLRTLVARRKVNANGKVVNGKAVADIDDSIVRGTTKRVNVAQFRAAGATRVDTRIASPPYKFTCEFGMDTKIPEDLIAHDKTVEQIREHIDSDSLAFLSLEGLFRAIGSYAAARVCTKCMTGEDPTATPVQISTRREYLEKALANLD